MKSMPGCAVSAELLYRHLGDVVKADLSVVARLHSDEAVRSIVGGA
jgi:hypothetical protein